MAATDTADRTVHVTGLSEKTDEAEIRKFFSFCGSLKSVKLEAGGKATLEFEKASAAKTASFLSGGTLQGSTISVTAQGGDAAEDHTAQAAHEDVQQHDKPRAAIAAEYLAAGYTLSDQTIARALELDQKHGISKRFTSFFTPLYTKAKDVDQQKGISATASSKLSEADAKYGLSKQAEQATQIGRSYYEKALSSSVGAQVQAYYLHGFKQVSAVHEEARRIADSKKPAPAAIPAADGGSASSVDPAATAGSTIGGTSTVPLPSSTPAA